MTTGDGATDKLIESILIAGLDDWQYLADVEWLVIESALEEDIDLAPKLPGPDPHFEDRMARVLAVLHVLFVRGLVVPGDVPHEFVPWDGNPEVWTKRIEEGWRSHPGNLAIGDVVWLFNTPEGDLLAASYMTDQK